ncbi:hypothetical protein LTR94_032386, partial [Friedmanniomyces endolithicus]
LPVGARHLRRRRAPGPGQGARIRRRRQAVRGRGRRPAGRVHPARDGPPDGQGFRRIPVAAQAQPHQGQAAEGRTRHAARRRPARHPP